MANGIKYKEINSVNDGNESDKALQALDRRPCLLKNFLHSGIKFSKEEDREKEQRFAESKDDEAPKATEEFGLLSVTMSKDDAEKTTHGNKA